MSDMQHTSSQQHRREQLLNAYSNEKDEDLVLFCDMQKREMASTHESVAQIFHRGALAAIVPSKSTEENIFTLSEHDYDWLMTPPPTPFIPTVKHETVGNGFSLSGSAVARSSPKATSRIGKSEPPTRAEPSVQIMRKSFDSRQPAVPSVVLTTSTSSVSQKSLSSRSSAPTHTSTPARSITPVSRPVARPSTPSKSGASSASIRSSAPTGRVATPSNHLASSIRPPSTPIKRPATPTRVNNPCNTSAKLLTVNKATSLLSKSASSSRPSSPATRVRQPAAHQMVLPGTLQEPPSNLKTSVVDRPRSNPRGSMALKANTTSAAKALQPQPADARARTRWLSSSPLLTRGHVSTDSLNGDKLSIRNGKPHDGVLISSKMVDRSMPPRKPIRLSQEETPVVGNSQGKNPVKSTALHDTKLTSQARESPGFGWNLSKKSLDMALRHMDIRGSTQSGFQSFMSNIPTSSLYSVRSGKSRSVSTGRGNSTSSIASSPMATSSNASSEHGMSIVIDPENSELGDETSSDMGSRASPMTFSNERKVTYWLGSPGYMDDTCGDLMEIFDQGLANLSSPESPLISEHGGILDCDDFALEPF